MSGGLRFLFWKPLSWLGTIRPTSAHDAFDPALWETFVSTTIGLEIPVLSRERTPYLQIITSDLSVTVFVTSHFRIVC